jgi:molybdate transport system regulatory protein
MKISARNILRGTVSKLTKGAVNAEVELALEGGDRVVAIITNESAAHLGLVAGKRAYAILKASWVILGKGIDANKTSARNVLRGTVSRIHQGAVNDEVSVRLNGGSEMTAIITRESTQKLGLKEGDEADLAFKANNVILAVD